MAGDIFVEREASEEATLDTQLGNKDPNRGRDGDRKKGISILEKMDELK